MKYDELNDDVKKIIDRQAEKFAVANCCTVETARELLAEKVYTTVRKPTGGMGH